ncbi:MAG: hypothetical protein JWQ03_2226 [Variovorax sp.]|nr:hypothetical protein [Variovorax sp.]
MTPRQLATEVRVAHEGRDHDTHARALALLLSHAEASPVVLSALDRHQLEGRRNELHVQLAAVNDRLQAIGATRNGDLAANRLSCVANKRYAASLDPSDPSA